MNLVASIFAALLPVAASADDSAVEFRALFVKSECTQLGGEPYSRCSDAPKMMLNYMDQAHRMRTMCPHPLTNARFVQMAFDCSDAVKTWLEGRLMTSHGVFRHDST